MNQTHPLYLRSDSPRDEAGSAHLEQMTSSGGSTFQQLSAYQTTTYYSHAPTTYVSSSFGHDRKDYNSPTIHGLTPVRLPSLGCGTSNDMHQHVGTSRQHPAAVAADQMNAFMEMEFFVDPDQGPSQVHADHDDLDVIVDDDGIMVHHLSKDVMSMEPHDELIENIEEEEKRHRNNEMARLRYHNMPDDQKRQVNSRRAEMIKKKRQDEKERRELEDILRRTNDVQDPEVADEMKKQQVRARRAESARSRYQRMSMAERKDYNYRRRLKAMGVDPDVQKDPSLVKATIARANAKKAEAARQRYHRMSSEERREYNMKRTETFRKRRMEEEVLLSTPAGRISSEALAKAQQIMVRNAKKAEAARIRYQRMTPEQRKEYNIRRAQSKRDRSRHMNNDSRSSHDMGDCTLRSSDISGSEMDLSFTSEPPSNILEPGRDLDVVNEPLRPSQQQPSTSRNANDEIFHQMEAEVIKKTQQAHRTITERQLKIEHGINQQIPGGGPLSQQHIYVQNVHMDDPLVNDDGTLMLQEQMMDNDKLVYQDGNNLIDIDEKMLADMVMTGRDSNGMPVEIRTADGRVIRDEQELRDLFHHENYQLVIQPPGDLEHKDVLYVNVDHEQLMTSSTSSQDSIYNNQQQGQLHHHDHHAHYEEAVEPEQMEQRMISQRGSQNQMGDQPITPADRQVLCKQRRAERARIRYHQMQPEIRQAQNARRAELLRKSRRRDERLMQLADSVDVNTLPDETQKAIEEARQRRERRAEQARAKYHRMNSEERRQYNAMRDAQRRQRKRQQEAANPQSASSNASGRHRGGPAHHLLASSSQLDNSSLNDDASDGALERENENVEEGNIIYNNYDDYEYRDWDPANSLS